MEKKLLKEVLSIQSYSRQESKMIKYIKQWCSENNIKFTNAKGNLYLTKGNAKCYPSFVAHTDTVHHIHKDMDRLMIVEHNSILIALDNKYKQTGIGGDDKVGIYLALRMLKRLKACKVALFHSEEIGCVGSKQANLKFFSDCAFILQADRRGYGDWITNIGGSEISSKEFQNAIKPIVTKYSYKFTSGAMTDVQALAENNVGISCANVSCGYYSPHTDYESVKIDEVSKVESMFYDIATKIELKRWENEVVKEDYGYYNDWYYGGSYKSKKKKIDNKQEELFCEKPNNNLTSDWKALGSYGWVKESPLYCPSCIDCKVYEKMGGSYFKFVCNNCTKHFMSEEPLTEDEAIAYLIDVSPTQF